MLAVSGIFFLIQGKVLYVNWQTLAKCYIFIGKHWQSVIYALAMSCLDI